MDVTCKCGVLLSPCRMGDAEVWAGNLADVDRHGNGDPPDHDVLNATGGALEWGTCTAPYDADRITADLRAAYTALVGVYHRLGAAPAPLPGQAAHRVQYWAVKLALAALETAQDPAAPMNTTPFSDLEHALDLMRRFQAELAPGSEGA